MSALAASAPPCGAAATKLGAAGHCLAVDATTNMKQQQQQSGPLGAPLAPSTPEKAACSLPCSPARPSPSTPFKSIPCSLGTPPASREEMNAFFLECGTALLNRGLRTPQAAPAWVLGPRQPLLKRRRMRQLALPGTAMDVGSA